MLWRGNGEGEGESERGDCGDGSSSMGGRSEWVGGEGMSSDVRVLRIPSVVSRARR